MRRTTEANASAATLKLMKPGPATVTDAIEGDSGSRATMRSAISRGFAPRDAREGEGDRAREIPVAVPAAALDRDLGQAIEREVAFVAKRRQHLREKRSDVLLHGPDTPRFARMGISRIGLAPARPPGDRNPGAPPARRGRAF